MKPPPARSLGPKFWAIVNVPELNPFVREGKLTDAGLQELKRTEHVTVERYVGIEKVSRTMTNKQYWDDWFRTRRASR